MGDTDTYALPFPDADDAPNGPTQMEALAEAVETELERIDDDLTNLLSAWQTYTPTIGSPSGSPTLGNGTVSAARYIHVGRLVKVQVDLVWGSSSSWGGGAGTVSLPVTARATSPAIVGTALVIEASPATRRLCVALPVSTTAVNLMTYDGTFVAAAVPWTWATGDSVRLDLLYEAAAGP